MVGIVGYANRCAPNHSRTKRGRNPGRNVKSGNHKGRIHRRLRADRCTPEPKVAGSSPAGNAYITMIYDDRRRGYLNDSKSFSAEFSTLVRPDQIPLIENV